MRAALLLCVLAVSLALASALPNANVCDDQQVQLELRPIAHNNYQLSFVAIDPRAQQNKADFVDIHYRSKAAQPQRRAAEGVSRSTPSHSPYALCFPSVSFQREQR